MRIEGDSFMQTKESFDNDRECLDNSSLIPDAAVTLHPSAALKQR
eukprot:CAMPEP_0168623838 /NCGR_PEP_ID=MMETSP0449_2-20121227/9054_1 /TAXON_ID=1082188 /ORGANISM="Strombidium rassoulzadegani, Strain ras09" /LENGTH=44 /DNA_ID= /DNA_START= /DNA_END= /DNA_ORIENTATION=